MFGSGSWIAIKADVPCDTPMWCLASHFFSAGLLSVLCIQALWVLEQPNNIDQHRTCQIVFAARRVAAVVQEAM